MASLDLSNPIDQLRLNCGDYSDLPFLPDSAYQHALDQTTNDVKKATVLCAHWLLAQLSFNVHEKMSSQLEVYGNQMFEQYKQYLIILIKNPNMSGNCPIPYGAGTDTVNPLVSFVSDWNANYSGGTQSELLHEQAIWSST